MKKLFLISSYCDTLKKKEVLRDNISLIKSLGHDILLLSPIDIENEYVKDTNYFFKTDENPVFSIETKTYIHWGLIENSKGERYRLERFFPEYGWAALYQNKKLSQIGLTFDYDIYYHLIYDTKFNDELINEINSNTVNRYYSNKSTNGDINEFSLHFLPLDKKLMITFESFLNKDIYVNSHDLTHDFLLKWVKQNNILKSNLVVEEHINYYTDLNFFSIYDGEECKLFFEKFEKDQEKNKFIIYDKGKENIKVIINDNIIHDNLKEEQPIETNMYTSEINKIEVMINDLRYDCTESYNKVVRNKILYL